MSLLTWLVVVTCIGAPEDAPAGDSESSDDKSIEAESIEAESIEAEATDDQSTGDEWPDDRQLHDFIEQPAVPPGRGHHHRHRRAARGAPIYGPILASGSLIIGPNTFGLGASLTRFVVPYIGLGIDIDEIVFIDSPISFNDFSVSAHIELLMLPYRRVTPYAHGSFGADIFSHRLGVYGLWKGGGGLIIRLGKRQRLPLRFGLLVGGDIPDHEYAKKFICVIAKKPCSLVLLPEVGLGWSFGGW